MKIIINQNDLTRAKHQSKILGSLLTNSERLVELDVGEKLKTIGLFYSQKITYTPCFNATILGVDTYNKLWVSDLNTKEITCLISVNLNKKIKEQGVNRSVTDPRYNVILRDKNNSEFQVKIDSKRLTKLGLSAGMQLKFNATGKTGTVVGVDNKDSLYCHFDDGDIARFDAIESKEDVAKLNVTIATDHSPVHLKIWLDKDLVDGTEWIKHICINSDELNGYNLAFGQEVLTPIGRGIVFGICKDDYLWFIMEKGFVKCWEGIKDTPSMHKHGVFSRFEYDEYMKNVLINPKRLEALAMDCIKDNRTEIVNKGVLFFKKIAPQPFSALIGLLEAKKINNSALFKELKKEKHEQAMKILVKDQKMTNKKVKVLEEKVDTLGQKIDLLTHQNQYLASLIGKLLRSNNISLPMSEESIAINGPNVDLKLDF